MEVYIMTVEKLKTKINKLKKEKNAVIMAHNYQIPDIQDISDHQGGSLQLAKLSKDVKNNLIVFCGVRFMAESIKILAPKKKILIPEPEAGCPMADMITREDMKKIRKDYPEYSIVAYVNTSAEVKAEADICCTSANAIDIVKNYPNDKIYFVPDKNLGGWVKKNVPEKEIKIWQGFCSVHNNISMYDFEEGKKNHPDACTLIHPEAPMDVLKKSDEVLSTGQMVDFVGKTDKQDFLIGTEKGLIYRLKTLYPDKNFYKLGRYFICRNMKKNTLKKLYISLKKDKYELNLDTEIRDKAYRAINNMFKY